MADGQVVFEITGDNSNIKRSLQDTTKAISDESKNWDKTVDDSSGKISGSLTGAFGKVVASAAFAKITQMLIQLGVDSVEVASQLEEVQNVVDVTFGKEGAKKIETWAKVAGDQFGLTELQAKKYASTLGAMMKSSGMTGDDVYELSTAMAGLAADMASFYNMDFDTAFQKIQSGIAGQTEPLRALGIDMSETRLSADALALGFENEVSKMSQAEKILLRYKSLMAQTADAQGDFARTSDNYANSQRRVATGIETLKAQIGEALLPIVTQVSNAINDLINVLIYQPPETALDKFNQDVAEAEGQASQAQGILGYMDKLYEKYGEAAVKTEEWATALARLQEVMPEVNQFISEEGSGLTVTNEQLREYIQNRKQALIEEARASAIRQLNEDYAQAGVDYYTAEINRDIAAETAAEARRSMAQYISSHAGHEDFTDSGFLTMEQMSWAAKDVAREFGESQDTINEWVRIYNEQTSEAQKATNSMADLEKKMHSLESQLNVANQALERLAAAAGSAAGSFSVSRNATAAVGVTAGPFLGSFASGLDYVPQNGWAYIHQGERIQTATEASLSRQFGLQQPSVDYGNIGAAMWANAPKMGGDVYLDSRIVGQVISQVQGRSYKNLQRSGWQQ